MTKGDAFWRSREKLAALNSVMSPTERVRLCVIGRSHLVVCALIFNHKKFNIPIQKLYISIS